MSIDFGDCDCDCHTSEYIMHMIPCCQTCPFCDRRLTIGYEKHVEECENKIKEAGNE